MISNQLDTRIGLALVQVKCNAPYALLLHRQPLEDAMEFMLKIIINH